MMYLCMAINAVAGFALLAGVVFTFAILGGQVSFEFAAIVARSF